MQACYKLIEFVLRSQFGVQPAELTNIVPMIALRGGLKERRGIAIGDAQVMQIAREVRCLAERELAVELQPIRSCWYPLSRLLLQTLHLMPPASWLIPSQRDSPRSPVFFPTREIGSPRFGQPHRSRQRAFENR